MDAKLKKFNVVCGRCLGSGKFDRGGCFGCDGSGGKTQKTKPRTVKHVIAVTLDTGKLINLDFFSRDRAIAVEVVERTLRIKKLSGTVK